jgi:hypothetical protein
LNAAKRLADRLDQVLTEGALEPDADADGLGDGEIDT